VQPGAYKISLRSRPDMGLGYLSDVGVQLQPLSQTGKWSVTYHPNGGGSDDSFLLGYFPLTGNYARFGQRPIILAGYYPDDIELRIKFDPLVGGFWAINNHDKTLVFTFYPPDMNNPDSLVTPITWTGMGYFPGSLDQRWLFAPA
jgi:hypothetical protein